MSLYELLKTFHVLVVAAWFGAAVLQLMLAVRVRTVGGDQAGLFGDFEYAGARLYPAVSVLAILTGAGMVVESDFVGFGDLWVVLALTGWLVSGIVGGVFIERAVKQGDLQRVISLAWLHAGLVVLIVADMVIKPA